MIIALLQELRSFYTFKTLLTLPLSTCPDTKIPAKRHQIKQQDDKRFMDGLQETTSPQEKLIHWVYLSNDYLSNDVGV